jgi:hypothetical protein
MSAHQLIYDLDVILPFFESARNPIPRSQDMVGIGVLLDGELVVAGVYERFNGVNVWGHVAALPGGNWKKPEILSVPFVYAFDVAKVQRITGYVDAWNTAANRFSESLGFKREAVLVGAAKDGGDVNIYAMRREDCRYVDQEQV